jgi:hypothetical protein
MISSLGGVVTNRALRILRACNPNSRFFEYQVQPLFRRLPPCPRSLENLEIVEARLVKAVFGCRIRKTYMTKWGRMRTAGNIAYSVPVLLSHVNMLRRYDNHLSPSPLDRCRVQHRDSSHLHTDEWSGAVVFISDIQLLLRSTCFII